MGYNFGMRVQTTEVYRNWINALKDVAGRARIQVRVDRLVHGNPGQHRNLEGGVSELKIDVGPGYRVYYTERGGEIIVLLAGGDKSTQQKDIRAALALARNL
jgi:putative addiction module killer protein